MTQQVLDSSLNSDQKHHLKWSKTKSKMAIAGRKLFPVPIICWSILIKTYSPNDTNT